MISLFELYRKIGNSLFRWTARIEYYHRFLYTRKLLTALLFNLGIFAFTAVFGYIRYDTCDDYLPAFFVSGVFGEYTHQLIYMNTL